MSKRRSQLSRASFERAVRDHHAAVYRSALRIVRDEATALDVTQQVYVALLEGRITLSGEGDERVLRWFGVRTALQELRGMSSRRAHAEEFAMQHENVTDRDPATDADAARFVDKIVSALPEDLRIAVRLRFDEGLTYAAIGEVLAISEPSAHERVQRALARLRERLSGAGLGAIGIGLEDHLARASATPPVPAHVAQSLMKLQVASMSALAPGGGLALALALSVVTVVAWTAFSAAHEPASNSVQLAESGTAHTAKPDESLAAPATSKSAARTPIEAVQPDRSSAVVLVTASTVEPQGTLRGRLVDDHDRPVPNVVLVAVSVERDGKFPRYSARARTGVDGAFSISVPVAADGPTPYEIESDGTTEPDGFEGLENPGKDRFMNAEADRVVDAGTLHLHPGPRDEPGNYTLLAHLVDEQGTPVVGATVVISRSVPSPDGFSQRTWEAGGPSDASGIVRLVGEHVGAKHLHVDARTQGFRALERDLIVAVGARDENIVLVRGLEIAGTLRDVDGHIVALGTSPAGNGFDIQVYARSARSPDDWIFAALDEHGAFLLEGLDEEPYDLEVQGGPWSRICHAGVRAGTRDVALVLKRDDDPRDVGDHCAEIHARVVDAVTHEPVAADVEAIEVVALPAGTTRARFDAESAPLLLAVRPVQTMWTGDVPATSDRVRSTGLDGGTYAFVVRVEGYATAMVAPIELAPHAVKNDVVVALVRPVEITGRVLDVDGRPLADAFVEIVGTGAPADAAVAEADENVRTTEGKPARALYALFATDAEGNFKIAHVTPGLVYTVVALHAHREPVKSGPIAAPPTAARPSAAIEIRFTRKR